MLNKAAFLQKLREVSPIRLIVGSFLAIILVGTLLLILPFRRATEASPPRSTPFSPPLRPPA